jgi:ElaB/YqjD/DUF883 family membrane-anchored ribosome-binding protein
MSKNIIDTLAADLAAPKEKLVAELSAMVEDAEELLKATSSQTGDIAASARTRIEKSLSVVRSRLQAAEASVLIQTRESAKVADQYVHENPWQSIGIFTCLGVVIGMLIKRQ